MKNYMQTGTKTLKDYQNYLMSLYGSVNNDRVWDYFYGYLSRTTSYLCKGIAVKNFTSAHFMRPISWLMATASHHEIDVEESFIKRYPYICPYCLSKPCKCFKTKKMPENYLPAYKAQEELHRMYLSLFNTKKITLDFCVDCITKVYPNNEVIWHHAGPWHHFSKLHEEVGELHEAASKYEAGNKPLLCIAEEVADTLAWLIGAWGIVNSSKSLDEEFINYYYNGCPVCLQFPCICRDRQDRSAGLADPDSLLDIQKQLKSLQELLPSNAEKISELIQSINVAVETNSESSTVHAVKETESSLSKIKNTISNVDDIGSKIYSIINKIMLLIEKFPF